MHANEKLSKIHDQRMRRAPYHDSASGEGPFPQDGVFGPVAPPAVALLAAVDMHEARDLAQLRVEAEDIARKAGQPTTTVHALLAVFTVQCPARTLLLERGVDEMRLLAALRSAPDEPEDHLTALYTRTHEIAAGLGVQADSLHLLIAISRSPETLAYALLVSCAVPLSSLRNTILSWYTSGRIPRQYLQKEEPREPAIVDPRPRARKETKAAATKRVEPKPPLPAREEPIEKTFSRFLPPPPPEAPEGEAKDPDVWMPPFDPLAFPNLSALGRNLSEAAAQRRFDPLVGRAREVEAAVDILGKRRGNNPVLVGPPGVGKTAIAEGIAQRLVELRSDRVIIELEVSQLVAGTSLRGAFAERLEAIKDEVRKGNGRIVLFIDEIHTLVGAGASGDGPQDAANGLKAALARGELPVIGATTQEEYRKFIEADPALERRFTPVIVEEPSIDEAVQILTGLAPRYGTHHGVLYSEEALRAAVLLSARHVHDRQLPDKAVQAIDLAGSRAARLKKRVVDVEEVAEVVAEMARLPKSHVLQDDGERLLRLEESLGTRIVGHREILSEIARSLRRNFAGLSSRRPLGSFLFLGPSGVGKTELAKALAEVLFASEKALVRFDMSEFSESHSTARLIGAPPGYVGFGEGGQLTEAVRRRPASVVLLDEIEKAHRDVWMLLLQMLDEGRLTDASGRTVDFTQSVVILTSNLGAEAFSRTGAPVGFGRGESEPSTDRALEIARRQIPPELWNRIDERFLFPPLGEEELRAIARHHLARLADRLGEDRRILLEFGEDVVEHVLSGADRDPRLGARPLRRAIERLVEAPLAEALLRGELPAELPLSARMAGERLVFHPESAASATL